MSDGADHRAYLAGDGVWHKRFGLEHRSDFLKNQRLLIVNKVKINFSNQLLLKSQKRIIFIQMRGQVLEGNRETTNPYSLSKHFICWCRIESPDCHEKN